jgi:hypothetical protein
MKILIKVRSLVLLFTPVIAIGSCGLWAWYQPLFSWLHHPRQYPWELWCAIAAATIAVTGGLADWRYHRQGKRSISALERRYEALALAGGVPLFLLMSAATLSPKPNQFIIPVIVTVLYMTVLICYDEFIFHRGCKPFETLLHRMLVFGNGLAWLAWAHWCFVRGGAYA